MNLKLRAVTRGAHVHVDVFVGADRDHLANAGRLVLGLAEWAAFAAHTDGTLREVEVDVDDGTDADAPRAVTLGVLIGAKVKERPL